LLDGVFVQTAGQAAEGTTITYFFDPDKRDKAWVDFVSRFEKRFGQRPDIYAAYGYDGARLLLDGIRRAGPNRYRIRDTLAALEHADGVTGHLHFDARWDNIAPIVVAQYRESRWRFQTAKQSEQAKAGP
jgi:branched-chain amino acid transport system substrate-binding protein